MQWIIETLSKLMDCKFYGKIELSFEHGHLVYFKKTETIKAQDLKKKLNPL